MADVKKLAPFILKWEGGFVNDPDDLGGATNMGVTIATYEAYCRKKGYPKPTIERLKNLSKEEWTEILKTMYWDRWKADEIKSQSVANILVDWIWASGIHGIKIARFDFIEDICRKRPANNKFKRGWLNRVNDIKFES